MTKTFSSTFIIYARRCLCLSLALCLLAPASFAAGRKVSKVVIDAGHGGTDAGAPGTFTREKELTLAIAMRLGKMIQDSLRDVQVIYTRTTDIYPSLKERHEIANRSNADLFVSIHINATAGRVERVQSGTRTVGKGRKKRTIPVYRTVHHRETGANGTETYVLGLHRNDQKEGAIGEYGDNITEEPGLLNPTDPQTAIIISQYSQAFFSRSVNLASKVQSAFESQGRADLGVKQKGLEVLAGSAMPGVLIECGFINNPSEESYMASEAGQTQIANAIFRGIRAYKSDIER